MLPLGAVIFTGFYLAFTLINKNPNNEYQLILPYFNVGHNQLGNFLGLGLIVLAYFLFNKKQTKGLFLWMIFIPVFLVSFSRSAYVAFFITTLFILLRSKSTKLFSIKTGAILGLMIITLFFFFTTVREAKGTKIFGYSFDKLSKSFNLENKDLTGDRLDYIGQGIREIKNSNPFFGVGAGNFGYISKKQLLSPDQWSDTSHSLFPEIFFENGGLAFVYFFIFMAILFSKTLRKNSLEGCLWLYLFIIFQFDYTYRIYMVFILFMALAGIFYEEKTNIDGSKLYTVSSFTMMLITAAILVSNIFYVKKNLKVSLAVYPFNRQVYQSLITEEQNKGNYKNVMKYANSYFNNFNGNLSALEFLGNLYGSYGEKEKEEEIFEKIASDNQYLNLTDVKKTYLLKKEIYGKANAEIFLKRTLRKYYNFQDVASFRKEVAAFCRANEEDFCRRDGWR